MDIREIKKLVDVMCGSNLTNLEIEQDGIKIKLEKSNGMVEMVAAPIQMAAPVAQSYAPQYMAEMPAAVQAPTAIPETETPVSNRGAKEVKAPMVGTFHDLTTKKVTVGSKLKAGDVLCIVEAMKLMNEISITEAGEIVTIEVAEGDMVEFGQVLFTYN